MSGTMFLGLVIWTLAVFVVGFFVGKKHGQKVAAIEQRIKDAIGKS